jgi:hypothetical protein
MSKGFPSEETVRRLREQYPTGCRVELVSMSDPYAKLKPGDQGTVTFVDSIGTVLWIGTAVPASERLTARTA